MLVDYFIVASTIAIASLIWWVWLDDHPNFHTWVKNLPYIGHPLDCSFCFPMWVTFATVFFFQPLEIPISELVTVQGLFGDIVRFIMQWFSVAAGMFLIRHTIFLIREMGAVYNHQHKKNHENDEKENFESGKKVE